MAKAIREKDGKAILRSYLSELLSSEDSCKGFKLELPPLRSLTASSSNLEELTWSNQWLEKEVVRGGRVAIHVSIFKLMTLFFLVVSL